FEPVEEWFHGMAARMVQHEFSHLEGELFVDRLPPIRKKMIQGKLHAMARGEVKTFYKTKIVQ
ncbi:MAG: peptide deformylase, partial [Bacteroidales bacterium]|nr:peptide deformylase [Bacteroidales bacterium]